MSLSIALNNALSGLQAAQKLIQGSSNNISNASTEGYTRSIVRTENRVVGLDTGAGTKVTAPQRQIDDQLLLASFRQLSITSTNGQINEILNNLAVTFGVPGQDDNLSAKFDKFFEAIDAFIRSPDDEGIRYNLVQSVDIFAKDVSRLATEIEKKRFDVDQEISRQINELNGLAEEGKKLNEDIGSADFKGLNKNALLDQRDALIKKVSAIVDVQVFYEDTGQFFLQAGKATLVDKNFTYKIDYTPAFSYEDFVDGKVLDSVDVYALKEGGQPIKAFNTIVTKGVSGTAKKDIENGSLFGLFELRDKILPNILSELDILAEQLVEQFNKTSNNGTGYPPPNTLTGVSGILSSSILKTSGQVLIAVADEKGAPVLDRYGDKQIPLNLDLSKLNEGSGEGNITVQTLVDEINEYYSGELQKVQVGKLDNIKIASKTDDLNITAGVATGVFQFDLEARNLAGADVKLDLLNVTLTDGVSTFVLPTIPATFDQFIFKPGQRTRTDTVDTNHTIDIDFSDPALIAAFAATGVTAGTTLAIEVQVQVEDANGLHTETITYNLDIPAIATPGYINDRLDVASISGIEAGILRASTDNTFPLVASFVDENGNLQSNPNEAGFLKLVAGRSNYGVAIAEQNSNITAKYEDGTLVTRSRAFSHFFGLNNIFETTPVRKNSAIELKLNGDIKKTTSLFPAAVLTRSTQSSVPEADPVWTYEVGKGNTQNARKFADLKFQRFFFAEAGAASSYNSTLGQYSADVISRFSTTSNQYIELDKTETALLDSINERLSSIKDVNIDEELAQLLLYQQLFSASARLISIADELFSTMIKIGQ